MKKMLKNKIVNQMLSALLVVIMLVTVIQGTPLLQVLADSAKDRTVTSVTANQQDGPFGQYPHRWNFTITFDNEIAGTSWSTSYQGVKLDILVNGETINYNVPDGHALMVEGNLLVLVYSDILPADGAFNGECVVTLKAGYITSTAGSYTIKNDFSAEYVGNRTFSAMKPFEDRMVTKGSGIQQMGPFGQYSHRWNFTFEMDEEIAGKSYENSFSDVKLEISLKGETISYSVPAGHAMTVDGNLLVLVYSDILPEDGEIEGECIVTLKAGKIKSSEGNYNIQEDYFVEHVGGGKFAASKESEGISVVSAEGIQQDGPFGQYPYRWNFTFKMDETLAGKSYENAFAGVKLNIFLNGKNITYNVPAGHAMTVDGALLVLVYSDILPADGEIEGECIVTLKAGTIRSLAANYAIKKDYSVEYVGNRIFSSVKPSEDRTVVTGVGNQQDGPFGQYTHRWNFTYEFNAELSGESYKNTFSGVELEILTNGKQIKYAVPAGHAMTVDGALLVLVYSDVLAMDGAILGDCVVTLKSGTIKSPEGNFKITKDYVLYYHGGRQFTTEQVKVINDSKTYDFYDVTQYAAVELAQQKYIHLGTMEDAGKKAVTMKVQLDDNAPNFSIGIGKSSTKTLDSAGWTFTFNPANNTISVTQSGIPVGSCVYELPKSFLLEVGTSSLKDKDGKDCGYCVFVKINGKTVLSGLGISQADTTVTIGNEIVAYAGNSSVSTAGVTISTLKKTTFIPVTHIVDGKEIKSNELVLIAPQVIEGKATKVSVAVAKSTTQTAEFILFKINGTSVKPISSYNNVYTFILESPSASDKFSVEVELHELTTDEAVVYDIYDAYGESVIERLPNENGLGFPSGNIIKNGQTTGSNTALRFRTTATAYDVWLEILGDHSHAYGYNGIMVRLGNGRVATCYVMTREEIISAPCDIYTQGKELYVEFGVVKCYEDGAYKYDRTYIKVGETVETMKTYLTYDSRMRGSYGTGVHVDTSQVFADFKMYSLKDIKTLTNQSAQSETEKLAKKEYYGESNRYAIWAPEKVIAYSDREGAEEVADIKLATKEGMRLGKLIVNGKDVTASVKIGVDGAYTYEIPSVTSNVTYSYTIVNDPNTYNVTVAETSHLEVIISKVEVAAAGETEILVRAEKGYVPEKISINGADYTSLFRYDAEKKGWIFTLSGIREHKEIQATAVTKKYGIKVLNLENGEVEFAGDVKNNKLPAGGTLEFTVKPENKWLIYSVKVNGNSVTNRDGLVTLDMFYSDVETVEIEIELIKCSAVERTFTFLGNNIFWICLLGAAVLAATGVVVVKKVSRKELPISDENRKDEE